jgi:hypothetical protein
VRYRPWALTNGIYEIAKRGVKRGAKGALPLITQTPRGEACILATGRGAGGTAGEDGVGAWLGRGGEV